MSANRHLGRIIALQTLFEQDFRRECDDKKFNLQEVLDRNINRYHETVDDRAFIKSLVLGVNTYTSEIDEKLQPLAPEWPISQI